MIKANLAVLIIILASNCGLAQLGINSQNLDVLKESKLIFIHPPGDEEELKLFKEQVAEVWKVNEIIVLSEKEYALNPPKGDFSYLTLDAQVNTGFDQKIDDLSISNTHVYLEISRNKNDYHYQFARIEMHISHNYTSSKQSTTSHKMDGSQLVYNYSLGYIKNVLGHISNYMGSNNSRDLYYEFSLPEMTKVKNDTLFIPDFVFAKYNSFGGVVKGTLNIEKVMSSYPYPYKILSNAELSKRILDKSTSFFYLMYIRSSTFKFISIWNSRANRMYYSKFSNPSYNFQGKDLKKIASKVKKK